MAASPITRRLQAFKAPRPVRVPRGGRGLQAPAPKRGAGLGIGPASAFWMLRALRRDQRTQDLAAQRAEVQTIVNDITRTASNEEIEMLAQQLRNMTDLPEGGLQP